MHLNTWSHMTSNKCPGELLFCTPSRGRNHCSGRRFNLGGIAGIQSEAVPGGWLGGCYGAPTQLNSEKHHQVRLIARVRSPAEVPRGMVTQQERCGGPQNVFQGAHTTITTR